MKTLLDKLSDSVVPAIEVEETTDNKPSVDNRHELTFHMATMVEQSNYIASLLAVFQ